MPSDSTHADLEALGIHGENQRCLLLLPIAYVAWASRRRDLAALDALLMGAGEYAHLDDDCVELARTWLRTEPTMAQFMSGLELLECSSRAPDQPTFASSDLLSAVVWASSAAQLDKEAAGLGQGKISASARRAIRDLEATLGVDIGELWADVMAELGDELPRSGNRLPPRFEVASESSRGRVPAATSVDVAPLTPASLTPASETFAFEYSGAVSIPFPLVRRTGPEA